MRGRSISIQQSEQERNDRTLILGAGRSVSESSNNAALTITVVELTSPTTVINMSTPGRKHSGKVAVRLTLSLMPDDARIVRSQKSQAAWIASLIEKEINKSH